MSKILEATCSAAGAVTSGDVVVPAVTVLSEGHQASTGLLLLDGTLKQYIASSATDIKTTIEKVADALDKLTDILTNIGAGMTGSTTAPPPTLAADILEITAIVTELDTLKDALK